MAGLYQLIYLYITWIIYHFLICMFIQMKWINCKSFRQQLASRKFCSFTSFQILLIDLSTTFNWAIHFSIQNNCSIDNAASINKRINVYLNCFKDMEAIVFFVDPYMLTNEAICINMASHSWASWQDLLKDYM